MPLVEQELLTLSDHQVFSVDHVAKSFSFLISVWSTIVYPFTFSCKSNYHTTMTMMAPKERTV
jgi:hypothetical protein